MVRLRLSINTSAFSFLRQNPQAGLLRDQKSPRVAGLKVPAPSWWSLEMARAPKHQIETRTCQQDTKIQLRTHPHSLQNECFSTWRSQWRWGWIEVVVRRICTHELTVCTLSQSSFVGCELLSMQSSVGPILSCPGWEYRRRRELEGSPLGTGQLCGHLCHHDIMCNWNGGKIPNVFLLCSTPIIKCNCQLLQLIKLKTIKFD